jgi:hypothetical protein
MNENQLTIPEQRQVYITIKDDYDSLVKKMNPLPQPTTTTTTTTTKDSKSEFNSDL